MFPLVFRRALFFLTGLACGGVAGWLWFGGEKSAPITSAAAAQFRAPHPVAQDFSAPLKTAPGRIAIESAAAPAASPEAAAAHGEFQRLLAETLHAPDEERTARLALLLARLRRLGPSGAEEILAYLRTGRELPRSAIYGSQYAKNKPDNALSDDVWLPDFHGMLLTVLAEITTTDPALATHAANETLRSARSMDEVVGAIRVGRIAEPEAIRSEATIAVKRLLDPSDEMFDLTHAIEVMGRTQAAELLPLMAVKTGKNPLVAIAFLDALWRFPDAARGEYQQRMLGAGDSRRMMQINPSMYAKLDLRKPDFCAAVLTDFPQISSEEGRKYLVDELGANTPPQRLTAQARDTPTEGEPGTKSQAAARLALLDSLAPFCDTPLLRQHLAESRAKLAKMLAAP